MIDRANMMIASRSFSHRRSGFSLTEILIVIALIVLLLALALPAFNFITGGRSVDGALNQINAMLARARTEAVGLQEPRGVMFYIDPKTEQATMVLVKSSPSPSGPPAPIDVYLDMANDEDHIPLPKGVGLQICNTNASRNATGQRLNDEYLGYNQFNFSNGDGPTTPTTRVGGVVLFDAFGRLASLRYAFRMQEIVPASGATEPTLIAKTVDPLWKAVANNTPQMGVSAVGFVVFDDANLKDYMSATGFDYREDPSFNGTPYPKGGGKGTENDEEQWLEDNGLAVMINRYNGTLLKGE